MAKKKLFADDGWAIWIAGDDTSTFYLNEWINPQEKNFVDVGIRIRGVKGSKNLNVYIPFAVEKDEIKDMSHHLKSNNVFRAVFSARCIFDYMKNKCTSEMAYHGKIVDLVHLSCIDYEVKPLAGGTLLTVPLDTIQEYLDNDEAYFIFRLPHKNLDEMFRRQIDVKSIFARLRNLLTSPVVSEKYICSVRVNEARLLPDEVNQIGAFHRQKQNKAVVTMSLQEDYQVNDANCYRIHRLDKEMYGDYAPEGFNCDDAVTYEWNESREKNLHGHFNFYFNITRSSISRGSLILYFALAFIVSWFGSILWGGIKPLLGL